ncbi:MAG: fused MFS/spermidine synthase [Flavobacteriales bacterium]|nr:fused MFS/spermidine synthase [Flavobacteriales bacterium]MCB9364161.1 fused MFS/spermidine synthase [Flavobacteriales bacterium]
MTKKLQILLFILAFIEGGAVMCVELCSAKILSPFFGTSIYVWAAVLGITLTALMLGYYFGGYLSSKNKKKETIFWLMLIAGFLATLTPILSDFVLPFAINLNLLFGAVVSLVSFMFFPLFLFGATSPLLINFLTENINDSGKSSGTVYAISTFGGIITTFTVGFYTLPEFGITNTLYAYGILVLAYTTFLFVTTRTFKTPISLIVLFALLSYNFHNRFQYENTLYESDGILGQVKVIERYYKKGEIYKPYRELLVNNICQTMMDVENPEDSYWDYVDILADNINHYKKGNKALLLGLGGGTLYKKLKQNNLNIDVVEIDKRIATIAKEFFFIENDLNITVDDARHYINTTSEKYDVIIYDLYHSETPPIHLMTKESFEEIKSILNTDGLLIINFYGYTNGNKGKGARSIYKTLKESNFNTHLIATPGLESQRNLLFINSPSVLTKSNNTSTIFIDEKDINLNDAEILVDNKPILEHIYLKAALDWRKNYNKINAKQFLN